MATEKKNPPLHKIKVGSATVAIWEQTPEKGEPFLTAEPLRPFKGKDEVWKNGHSFTLEHMESLIDALIDAKEWMRQHRLSQTKAA